MIGMMRIVVLVTLLAHAFANSGFVVAPLVRTTASTPQIKEVDNNRGFVPQVLHNKINMYMAIFKLGGQRQIAVIDTGSADLWVYDSKSGASVKYDTVTGENLGEPFKMRYMDGTKIKGDYYSDDFAWGEFKVNLKFGVSYNQSPTSIVGVLGIADKNQESAVIFNKDEAYDNLPSALKNQGLTHSVSYSLNLRGIEEATGSIVFGAFDTSRFLGRLKVFDVNTRRGFAVPFQVNGNYQVADLDSGTSLCYLDSYVVDEIAQGFGAVWDEVEEAFGVTDLPEDNLVFNFDKVRVTMPSSELWQEIPIYPDRKFRYYLTILPNTLSNGVNLLGVSFLRSAYVVFDLDHKQVAIGQAVSNRRPSNYMIIGPEGISPEYTV